MHKAFVVLLVSFLVQVQAQTTLDTALYFSVKDITGQTHDLWDILDNGQMVVIDFFSTSCGPCGTYVPSIEASYRNFGMNNGNVYFLGIAWGDSNNAVHLFDSLYGLTFPSVSGAQGNGNQVVLDYNILSYPTLILIMPDRSIREQHIWPPTTAHIDSVLMANGAISTGLCPTDCIDVMIHFKVWPNPSSGSIQIRHELNQRVETSFSLIDLQGRIHPMGSTGIRDVGPWEYRLDANHLPTGMYFLHIQQGNVRKSLPVILQ